MLFDIGNALKGYAGGFCSFDGLKLGISMLLGSSLPMMEQSASLSCMDFGRRLAFGWGEERSTSDRDCALGLSGFGVRCAEVRTSRIRLRPVQLESLILAQNERWRQA